VHGRFGPDPADQPDRAGDPHCTAPDRGKRFDKIEDVISVNELLETSRSYQRLAGWDVASVARAAQ
jgi:hypothetical protein